MTVLVIFEKYFKNKKANISEGSDLFAFGGERGIMLLHFAKQYQKIKLCALQNTSVSH